MTLLSHAGSFASGTGAATTTVAVTGVGFVPKAILFWWSGRTEGVDTIGRATHYRGFGVACTTTDRRAVANTVVDAAATSDTQGGHSDAACIILVNTGAAIDAAMDLQSMDADGFTLIVDDAFPRDTRIGYLALGGDSLTDVASGQFIEPAATGDQDTTSLAFQPDSILFFSAQNATAPPTAAVQAQMMIGAATSSSAQGVWAGTSRNGQAAIAARSYCTAGECIALQAVTGAPNGRADFVSFLSNGFRINWAERAALRYVFFLALKGGNYTVGNLLTQTDTVTDIVESSFGYQPTGALLVSHGQAESTSDTDQGHDRLSIGAFSGTAARGAQGTLDEDTLADSEVTAAMEFDEVYVNIKTDSTIDGLMDIKSIDSDGFTTIMDDADPAQAFVWYMAFGPAAAAAGGWGKLLSDKRNRLVL